MNEFLLKRASLLWDVNLFRANRWKFENFPMPLHDLSYEAEDLTGPGWDCSSWVEFVPDYHRWQSVRVPWSCAISFGGFGTKFSPLKWGKKLSVIKLLFEFFLFFWATLFQYFFRINSILITICRGDNVGVIKILLLDFLAFFYPRCPVIDCNWVILFSQKKTESHFFLRNFEGIKLHWSMQQPGKKKIFKTYFKWSLKNISYHTITFASFCCIVKSLL